MAKLKPLYDRVVIKRVEEEVAKTPAGIIIPDTASSIPLLSQYLY